ncbi:hypothetical protein HK105_208536 [Polyrhizophydium stewartii]|uniref:L domain-like protein n=1 Tax=Polyrhizophydium stewartii TaxID=2732419 RepID=A0ABR4MXP5_9FUNG
MDPSDCQALVDAGAVNASALCCAAQAAASHACERGRVVALTLRAPPAALAQALAAAARMPALRRLAIDAAGPPTPLPDALGRLAALESLSITRCGITAPIPDSLAALSSLTALDLSANGIPGGVPPWLASLPRLRTLDLSDNQLSGTLPWSIARLSKLQHLDVSGNAQLSGSIPAGVSRLANLMSIDVAGTQLNAVGWPDTALPALKSIDVTGTPFSATQMLFLAGRPLEAISLSLPVGLVPSWLIGLKSLRRLGLTNSSLTEFPTWILNMTQLQHLDLSGNRIKAFPRSIERLGALQHLDLSNNQIVGEPPLLRDFLNLTSLNISHNNINSTFGSTCLRVSKFRLVFDVSWNRLWGEATDCFRGQVYDVFRIDNNPGIAGNIDYNFAAGASSPSGAAACNVSNTQVCLSSDAMSDWCIATCTYAQPDNSFLSKSATLITSVGCFAVALIVLFSAWVSARRHKRRQRRRRRTSLLNISIYGAEALRNAEAGLKQPSSPTLKRPPSPSLKMDLPGPGLKLSSAGSPGVWRPSSPTRDDMSDISLDDIGEGRGAGFGLNGTGARGMSAAARIDLPRHGTLRSNITTFERRR